MCCCERKLCSICKRQKLAAAKIDCLETGRNLANLSIQIHILNCSFCLPLKNLAFLFMHSRVMFDKDSAKHSLWRIGNASLMAATRRSKSHLVVSLLFMKKISFSLAIRPFKFFIQSSRMIFKIFDPSFESQSQSVSIFDRMRKKDFPMDLTFFASSRSCWVNRDVVKMRKVPKSSKPTFSQ